MNKITPYEIQPTGNYVHYSSGISIGGGASLSLPKKVNSNPVAIGSELYAQPQLLPLLKQNNNLPKASFLKGTPLTCAFKPCKVKQKYPCLAHSFFE